MEASFDQSYTLCFKEIQVPSKLRVLPSGTFFLNSGLRKKTCYQLSSRKQVAASVINWTVVGQLS